MSEKKKITITLPAETVTILEKKCEQLDLSKSDYIDKLINSTAKTGRKEKLTQDEKQHIKNLYTIGVSVTKIAKQLECSRNLIYKIIKEQK